MAFGFCRARQVFGVRLVLAWAAILVSPLAFGVEVLVRTPAEIRAAAAKAKPGDTLVMANGEWRDVVVTFEGNGTEDKPIILRAETPGKVVLCGQSRVRIGGSFLVVDGLLFRDGYLTRGSVFEFRSGIGPATDSRLTNSAFVEYNPPDRSASYKWVSLFGERNRVDHCRFAGQDHVGQAINVWNTEEPNYHRIDHNFFGPRPPLGRNGGETLKIGNSTTAHWNSRTLVERNVFFECDGEGEIITNKSSENIYRSNTFIRSAGALTLRHGDRNRVEGNYFFGEFKEGTGGVRVINAGQIVVNNYFQGLTGRGFSSPLGIMNGMEDAVPHEYYRVKDAVIAFNTFVDCDRPVAIGLGAGRPRMTLAPENLTMANNIFVARSGPVIQVLDEAASVNWAGNLVHGAAAGISVRGIVEANPLLEKGEDGVFRPGARSPAREAAEGDFGWVRADISGRSRGNALDIGAHQFGGAGEAEWRPVKMEEVGIDFGF